MKDIHVRSHDVLQNMRFCELTLTFAHGHLVISVVQHQDDFEETTISLWVAWTLPEGSYSSARREGMRRLPEDPLYIKTPRQHCKSGNSGVGSIVSNEGGKKRKDNARACRRIMGQTSLSNN